MSETSDLTRMKQITYKVEGMHCASCELLIEEKLIQFPQVEAVDASTAKGQLTVYYENEPPSDKEIQEALKEDGYCLCEECGNFGQTPTLGGSNEILKSLTIAALVFGAFLLINRLGLSSSINVSASSSLPAFFLFGLLAGVSTCAALTGGIVLSMAREWGGGYKPHLLFNAGRIASYAFFGAVLGMIGSKLQLSLTFNAFLVIAVSVFMVLNGLKMFGLKALRGFQVALPKSLTHKAAGKNFKGKYMPLTMGALTILLPCGFTITVESLSLLSGNWVQGAAVMAAFALGTAPGLLAIGFSSVKMGNSPRAAIFSKVAGALVLMFAIFNINSQLNVLSLPSLSNLSISASSSAKSSGTVAGVSAEGLAPIVEGKQLLKMQASSSGYTPNYFKVKADVPVRFEITDTGTSGCTNAIMSNSLFEGQIPLTPGQVSVKEFTPTKAGRYKFSCWMGMVTGIIEVISQDGSVSSKGSAPAEIPSGAKGCGCGGGGGGSCGGGS